MNNKPQFLTIEEKRAWLAHIFRDTSGEYTDADKLKALEADNRLVMIQKPTVKKKLDTSERGTLVPPHPKPQTKKYRNDHQSTHS